MYQIGLFSKMNRITTKTLRHYDKLGLLKPEYVDCVTGYRYYTNEQLPELHQILALRQLGLNLTEIQEIKENPVSLEIFLKLKEKELQEQIREEQLKLSHIQTWQDMLKGGKPMNYSVILKKLPPLIVASMRTLAPSYDSYFELIPPMGEEMTRRGAVCAQPAYCFTIYHDGEFKERNIDIEVCEAVVEACEDSEMVQYKKIPSVPMAVSVLHKGPYSTLRNVYAFAFQWIRKNGYETAGNPRESYIDGIWNKENEQDWLTELQVPVQTCLSPLSGEKAPIT